MRSTVGRRQGTSASTSLSLRCETRR
uniref:Uncharacterized protein n=1 Tax=Arundo donax TaxID=35708 RepID=A0A0A9BWI8_ARUDO